MDEKIPVKITIAERNYPLKIDKRHEEKLRRAAKLINDDLGKYAGFTERDAQDRLAITALQFVFKLIDFEENQDYISLRNDLRQLDEELELYLEKQNVL